MMEKASPSTKNTTTHSKKSVLLGSLVVLFSWSVSRLVANGEPLYHILPNILLYTPLHHYAHKLYDDPADVLPEKREHIRIREISGEDYSYEYMREVTEGFSKPVIVKGLFSNTTAGKYWDKPGFLKEKIGDLIVPVYHSLKNNTGGVNINHETASLLPGGPIVEDIMVTKNSDARFIFPQFAVVEKSSSDPVAMYAKAEELMKDVELFRLREGWGKEDHLNYIGQQIFIGCGLKQKNSYSGITWHTEPGNNWFIQVTGKKRWFMVEPKDSSLMLPKKKTARLIITSDIEYITELHDRLPVLYGDVGPGDLIFNPEWYWHKTQVYPGPSISISMREFYTFRNIMSSPHYCLQFLMRLPFEMQAASFIARFMKKMFFLS